MSSLTQWQPTAQLVWVRRGVKDPVLCQTWIETFMSDRGPQMTGNARLQEILVIDEPQQPEVANDPPASGLIL